MAHELQAGVCSGFQKPAFKPVVCRVKIMQPGKSFLFQPQRELSDIRYGHMTFDINNCF